MTSHAGRLYALAAAVLVFFVVWAAVAARPWSSHAAARDPRLVALARREHRLRSVARLVQRVVDRRFAAYRKQLVAYHAALARRRAQLAAARSAAAATAPAAPAAPAASAAVRVVTLPPLVITRTS